MTNTEQSIIPIEALRVGDRIQLNTLAEVLIADNGPDEICPAVIVRDDPDEEGPLCSVTRSTLEMFNVTEVIRTVTAEDLR